MASKYLTLILLLLPLILNHWTLLILPVDRIFDRKACTILYGVGLVKHGVHFGRGAVGVAAVWLLAAFDGVLGELGSYALDMLGL